MHKVAIEKKEENENVIYTVLGSWKICKRARAERKVARRLKERYNIICACGVNKTPARKAFSGDVIRASTHYYSSHGDVDKLVQALKEIKRTG